MLHTAILNTQPRPQHCVHTALSALLVLLPCLHCYVQVDLLFTLPGHTPPSTLPVDNVLSILSCL